MLTPRKSIAPFLAAALLFCASSLICAGAHQAHAQESSAALQSERERGIELYQQGNDQAAIEALRSAVKRDKNDLRAWHYLGLAFGRQGKRSDARKAHEKAAKIGEGLLVRQYGASSLALLQERFSELKTLFDEAAESADKYLELSSNPSQKKMDEWQERAEFLREFSLLANPDSKSKALRVLTAREVTTKARILSRPEPQYTKEARKHDVTGTVVLKAIFAAEGKVINIRPVATLPYGLTVAAIRAARRIKFIPAMVNGEPVSQYIQIEYNFSLY